MRVICLGALLLLGLAGCKKEERPNYPTTPATAPGAPGAPAAPAKPGAPAPGDNGIAAQDFRDGKS
jgi:hypothetical protein